MALTKTNLANIVEGILPVANGGTGVTTSTGSGAVVLGTSPTLTTPTLTTPTITGAVVSSMASSVITSGTVQNTTSGTSIDFTGIPSWVKRITVMFSGVSTNGTSIFRIQLGTSSGVTSSGYFGNVVDAGGSARATYTAGFSLALYNTASYLWSGSISIQNINGNNWIAMGTITPSAADAGGTVCGGVPLGAVLDRVRITTVNGTDTFDAGSINILYE
jgi:hypothetical protein